MPQLVSCRSGFGAGRRVTLVKPQARVLRSVPEPEVMGGVCPGSAPRCLQPCQSWLACGPHCCRHTFVSGPPPQLPVRLAVLLGPLCLLPGRSPRITSAWESPLAADGLMLSTGGRPEGWSPVQVGRPGTRRGILPNEPATQSVSPHLRVGPLPRRRGGRAAHLGRGCLDP